MEKPLDQQVRDALIGRVGDWQLISREAAVSHSWLSKFVNGKIPNPGYATLQRLHGYLAPRRRASDKQPAQATQGS